MNNNINKYILRLLVAILIIVPLATRTKILTVASPVMREGQLGTGDFANIFTYYKFIFLATLFVAIAGLFVYKLVEGHEIKDSYINKPLTVMALIMIISGFLAPYTSVALFGKFSYYEGTLTYLIYMGLFFITANISLDKGVFIKLLYALIPLTVVNTVMGVMNYYGVVLLKYSIVKTILFPSEIPESAIKLGSYLSSTLFNPNYVSGIGAVIMLLFLTYACLTQVKKQKALGIVISLFAFMMIITSLSSSGFITAALLIPVVVVAIIFSHNRVNGMATLLIALIVNAGAFSILYTHNHKIWNESIGFFIAENSTRTNLLAEGENTAKDITFADPENAFNLPKAAWGAGTGRLYIWEKTMELIKKKPFFGYGMNTLAYFFPQDDPNINSNLYNYNTTVDKTHNMYLGIAFGSGVITLVVFLILLALHSYKVVRVYFAKDFDQQNKTIIISLFISWVAYLIQGLFNDSFIGTAPIFWILFGVSVAVVNQYRKAQS